MLRGKLFNGWRSDVAGQLRQTLVYRDAGFSGNLLIDNTSDQSGEQIRHQRTRNDANAFDSLTQSFVLFGQPRQFFVTVFKYHH